jgi:hypothetical protein
MARQEEADVCGRGAHRDGKRIIVDGIMHPAGKLPIRFKSRDRAERHIKTMKLEK